MVEVGIFPINRLSDLPLSFLAEWRQIGPRRQRVRWRRKERALEQEVTGQETTT